MSKTTSPLRYPGGKSCLFNLTEQILRLNKLQRCAYAEPFAGGGGLALNLLFEGVVSSLYLNDIDEGIWSFWKSILDDTEEFLKLMESTPLTIKEWRRWQSVISDKNSSTLELGFATFCLNRTNRSGIIKNAGVIGGLEQTGNYKMDCRFNKDDLKRRILRVAKYRSCIHLTKLDAIDFLQQVPNKMPDRSFVCIDPPYFNKGSSLYTSFYKEEDHAQLCDEVMKLDLPWIVTYDDTPEIRRLYRGRRQYGFDINYSVQTKRVGTELLIASKGLWLPSEIRERQLSKAR